MPAPGLHLEGQPKPVQPCISQQSGGDRAAPAIGPADRDFGTCSHQGKRQEGAGKGLLGPVPTLEGQLCTARRNQGSKEAVRRIRRRNISHGNSKASRAGGAGWTGGEEELPAGGSSFCLQGPYDPFQGESPGLLKG